MGRTSVSAESRLGRLGPFPRARARRFARGPHGYVNGVNFTAHRIWRQQKVAVARPQPARRPDRRPASGDENPISRHCSGAVTAYFRQSGRVVRQATRQIRCHGRQSNLGPRGGSERLDIYETPARDRQNSAVIDMIFGFKLNRKLLASRKASAYQCPPPYAGIRVRAFVRSITASGLLRAGCNSELELFMQAATTRCGILLARLPTPRLAKEGYFYDFVRANCTAPLSLKELNI